MTEKSLPQPASPQTGGRRLSPYALGWAVIGACSLLYLGLLATQPEMVARMLGVGHATAEADATKQAVGEAVAEVRTLRDTIDLFRNELIEIRAQVSSQSDGTRELTNRIAALETPSEPQRVATTAKDTTAAKAAALAAAQKTAAAKAAKKAAQAANPQQPDLETGSVAGPAAGAISFGPPTVTPAALPPPSDTRLIGVRIATGPSVESLRLNWTLLSGRHADSFRDLQPRYSTGAPGPDQTFDLIVGPIASVDAARQLCQDLAMKATPCAISRFTGDALF